MRQRLTTLVAMWLWTAVLHVWMVVCRRRRLVEYYRDLADWQRSCSWWCARHFRYHPAWLQRYMASSSFLYALAYQEYRGYGRLECLKNVDGTLKHVYVVDDDTGDAMDFLGTTAPHMMEYRFKEPIHNLRCDYKYGRATWHPHVWGELAVLKLCIRVWRQ